MGQWTEGCWAGKAGCLRMHCHPAWGRPFLLLAPYNSRDNQGFRAGAFRGTMGPLKALPPALCLVVRGGPGSGRGSAGSTPLEASV